MDVGDGAGVTVAVGVEFGPGEFEHLDFDAFGEGAAFFVFSIRPEEGAGVAAGLHVAPLDVEDEVFVLFVATHDTDFFAMADEDAVFDAPGVGRGVDVGPAGEVFAVEEADPLGEFERFFGSFIGVEKAGEEGGE